MGDQLIYKEHVLLRKYISDLTIMNKIVLGAKAVEILTTSLLKQTLNYLAASKLRLGIQVNFGEDSLKYKRIIL